MPAQFNVVITHNNGFRTDHRAVAFILDHGGLTLLDQAADGSTFSERLRLSADEYSNVTATPLEVATLALPARETAASGDPLGTG